MNWKPIEDGLPPVGVPLVATIEGEWCAGKERRVAMPVYYIKCEMTRGWRFVEMNSGGYSIIGPDLFKVVAWDYYPEPYRMEQESR